MYKYYVIIMQDDNTVYRVFGCETKTEARKQLFYYADSSFVTCLVTGDCFEYSDDIVVKKARTKIKVTER